MLGAKKFKIIKPSRHMSQFCFHRNFLRFVCLFVSRLRRRHHRIPIQESGRELQMHYRSVQCDVNVNFDVDFTLKMMTNLLIFCLSQLKINYVNWYFFTTKLEIFFILAIFHNLYDLPYKELNITIYFFLRKKHFVINCCRFWLVLHRKLCIGMM